jgi:hypothetical protein
VMRATLYGWWQTRKPEFRRDLLLLIGASTPQKESDLALAHAQAIARTFTAMTLCRRRKQKMIFSTPEVETFLREAGNLSWVDEIWNRALEGR